MPLVSQTWPEVLATAWPGAGWSLRGNDLSTLVWEGPGDAPSVDEVEAAGPAAWLSLARQRAAEGIDRQAEAERLVYITGGAGQAMVYLEKQREARSAAEIVAGGGEPSTLAYPLLAAAVGVDIDPRTAGAVTTVAQAAEVILLIAAAWAVTAADIEGRRLRAKRLVSEAETIAAVEAAMVGEGWTVP